MNRAHGSRPSRSIPLALAIFVVLAAVTEARALTAFSRIKGTVRADDGTEIPGAIVTLACGTGTAAAAPVRILTDPNGGFDFARLDPALPCSIRAEVPGFATVEAGPIQLKSGRTAVQVLRLIPAADMTTKIVVEARGATVDTESAVTSTTINQEYIEALPLVGRSFQDLLTLAPGVTDADGDGNPNIHGARDTGLQYRLDGADITDPLTGHFGQVLNLDAIQEVELITSGASAEFGRADGGFANITTKSGTNQFEGALRVFYRARFLDGDGANNNDTFVGARNTVPDIRDMKTALTLGGPIVTNKLWYFTSVQSMDIQTPISLGGAGTLTQTVKGYQGLVKLTWQIDGANKVALEGNFDPQRFGGLGLRPGVLTESDYALATGGLTTTFRWTSIVSPVLLLETSFSHYDKRAEYDPVSNRFDPVRVQTRVDGGGWTTYALYPCNVTNCFRALRPTNIYQIDDYNNVTSGPFFFKDGDRRVRNSLRSDFTLTLDDFGGSHTLKSGFEFTDEIYQDNVVSNPILSSYLHPPRSRGLSGGSNPLAVEGYQLLTVFDSLKTGLNASGGGIGSYVQESWKPKANLTIGVGLRLDQEVADSYGKEPFALRAQARKALYVFDLACEATGVLCSLYRTPGKPSGGLPIALPIPPGSPLAQFDLDEDGFFEGDRNRDGAAIWGRYSRPEARQSENFTMSNLNFAPRFSFSWDPWNDGRTRVSGTVGRYYNRLILGEATVEQNPDQLDYLFFPGPPESPVIQPGDRSAPSYTRSIFMLNRNLGTPYTDERTFSIEREIAPEWSVSVTSISRRGWDLLQDFDVNHITCADYKHVLGVDPRTICGEANGLDADRFGGVSASSSNGAVDLYNLNPFYDQIFRLGNYNGSRYRAVEVVLNRRLQRNWQMQASYTRSHSIGDAEQFLSFLGDDPAARDHERGYLDYDQRDVVKLYASTNLPKRVVLGTTVQWSSGTPYSAVSRITDLDDIGNPSSRFIYLHGRRNDQRNGGQWTASARIEKGFSIAGCSAEAFFAAENLLNSDDLILRESTSGGGGSGLRDYQRRFGRRWEMGASVHF